MWLTHRPPHPRAVLHILADFRTPRQTPVVSEKYDELLFDLSTMSADAAAKLRAGPTSTMPLQQDQALWKEFCVDDSLAAFIPAQAFVLQEMERTCTPLAHGAPQMRPHQPNFQQSSTS